MNRRRSRRGAHVTRRRRFTGRRVFVEFTVCAGGTGEETCVCNNTCVVRFDRSINPRIFSDFVGKLNRLAFGIYSV